MEEDEHDISLLDDVCYELQMGFKQLNMHLQ